MTKEFGFALLDSYLNLNFARTKFAKWQAKQMNCEGWMIELEGLVQEAADEQTKNMATAEAEKVQEKYDVMTDFRKMWLRFSMEVEKCLKAKAALMMRFLTVS